MALSVLLIETSVYVADPKKDHPFWKDFMKHDCGFDLNLDPPEWSDTVESAPGEPTPRRTFFEIQIDQMRVKFQECINANDSTVIGQPRTIRLVQMTLSPADFAHMLTKLPQVAPSANGRLAQNLSTDYIIDNTGTGVVFMLPSGVRVKVVR